MSKSHFLETENYFEIPLSENIIFEIVPKTTSLRSNISWKQGERVPSSEFWDQIRSFFEAIPLRNRHFRDPKMQKNRPAAGFQMASFWSKSQISNNRLSKTRGEVPGRLMTDYQYEKAITDRSSDRMKWELPTFSLRHKVENGSISYNYS